MTAPIMLELFFKRKVWIKDCEGDASKRFKGHKSVDVNYISCNNASENEASEKLCKQEGMGEKFEYTMPDTPQQYGQIK